MGLPPADEAFVAVLGEVLRARKALPSRRKRATGAPRPRMPKHPSVQAVAHDCGRDLRTDGAEDRRQRLRDAREVGAEAACRRAAVRAAR